MTLSKLSRVDVLLSVLALFLLQAEVWIFDPGSPAWARSILGLIAAAALAFLNPFPVEAYLVNGFAIYGLIALGSPSDLYQWTNFIALVLMAARTPVRRGIVPLLLGLAGVAFYFVRFPNEGGVLTMLVVQSLYLAGFLGGTSQRSRMEAERLTSERDLAEARLAANSAKAELEAERTRMARELHDVVGHALTAMVVQAAAGERVLDGDSSVARKALATIATQGREALADMDRMLSLLHGEAPRTRMPRLEDMENLIEGMTGITVERKIEGELGRVPSSVSLTAYRIVQEALTNAMRHSQATLVVIEVTVGNQLVVRVTDNGVGRDPNPGRGLTGMAERVELHRGTLRFGEAAGGGFELEARIPIENEQ